jgi:molybdate-binding protein
MVSHMDEISHIDAVDSVRVLANDERLHLLRLLMRGPATLTQLGAVMGHHPAWVRHHLLSLQHAGLVELVETRQTKNFTEKFYCATARAYAVDFMVLPEAGEDGLLVLLGSDDLALDLLAQRLRESAGAPDVVTIAMGSLEGLIALRQGLGHVAGCHLLDPETGDFNRSYARALFPGRELMLVTLAHRQQGLILPAGNPRGFHGLDAAVTGGARIVNRNRGSGTRVWLDRLLAAAGVDPADVAGYEREVATHEQAARAVADGTADVALGIFAAALAQGLDFVPLMEERYDLVTPTPVYESELMAPLLEMLRDDGFKRSVDRLGGYATRETGAATVLAA